MTNQQITRNYNITDAELAERTDSMIISATRDAAQLIPAGFTVAMRTALGAKRTALTNLQPDYYWMGRTVQKRVERDDAAAAVEAAATVIRNRAKNAFFTHPEKLSRFGDALSQLEPLKLKVASGVIVKAAQDFAADFVAAGIIVDPAALVALNTALDDAITAYETEKNLRSAAAIERINAGNALYKALSYLAQVGKSIWEGVNPAYYNEYVINVNSGSSNQHRSGSINNTEKIISDVTISDPDVHTIFRNNSTDGSLYQAYCTHLDGGGNPLPPATPPQAIPSGSSLNVRMGEIGWDTLNNILVLEGLGPNAVPYEFTVLG